MFFSKCYTREGRRARRSNLTNPSSSVHEHVSLQPLLPGEGVSNDGGEIIVLWSSIPASCERDWELRLFELDRLAGAVRSRP